MQSYQWRAPSPPQYEGGGQPKGGKRSRREREPTEEEFQAARRAMEERGTNSKMGKEQKSREPKRRK